MKRICTVFILVTLSYLFSNFNPIAIADEGRISDIKVVLNKESILVSSRLINGFDKKIEEEINSGIEKDIVYEIVLKRKRSGWYDEDVISKEIKYTVKYDLLKKQYSVKMQGNVNKEKIVQNYDEIKTIVSMIENIILAQSKVLESDEEYYVSIKAEMKDARLFFFLDYFLFFIPFSDIDTSWADSAAFKLEKKP